MVIGTIKMTARQFLELGQDPPGVRLELVDGEIAVTPSLAPDHSYTERMLTILLGQHILAHDLGQLFGDVDTILGEHDVRRPDLIFFRKDRLHLVGKKAMEGPPDLGVEVISPSSVQVDRRVKFAQYQAAGMAHYWMVDPDRRTAEAYRLERGVLVPAGAGRDSDVVRFPPFADLDLTLARLWRPKLG